MSEKIGIIMRLNYLCWAFILFCWGLVFLIFAWTIIGIPLWIACWGVACWVVIFAIRGRDIEDWKAERDAKKAIKKQKHDALVKKKMTEMD